MACFDTRAAETNAHAAKAVPLLCGLCLTLFAKVAAGELDTELPDGLVEWYVEHLRIDGT
jgi:hypothetical protein